MGEGRRKRGGGEESLGLSWESLKSLDKAHFCCCNSWPLLHSHLHKKRLLFYLPPVPHLCPYINTLHPAAGTAEGQGRLN